MNNWCENKLYELVDIRVSNVDKKIYPNKKIVHLCNYMDAYTNNYITSAITFSTGSADLNESQRFSLLENDVVITKDSETPEDIAVPSVVAEDINNLVCGYHLAILRPKTDQIFGPFLMHKMNLPQVQKYFFRIASGSTRYGLTIGGIGNAILSHPPLSHQRKIARILTTVDNIIEKTEAAIAKYKAIKQGMMYDLFTRGMDIKTGKLRPAFEDSPELYKESELGMIPKEWEIVRLGDERYFDLKTGGTPSTARPEYWGWNIPWMVSGEVHKKRIYYVDNTISELGYQNSNAYMYPVHTIVIALAGQGKTRGTVALTYLETTSNQSIVGIICKQANPFFFYFLIDSQYENLRAVSAGAGRAGLSIGILAKYLVVYPNEVEQRSIEQKLDSIDKTIMSDISYLMKTKCLKQGLMQDLLTGKKEVTLDPEDFKELEN